jgi:valyl-tRNA synthetase
MSEPKNELPKAYDPKSVEQRLYETWESSGYFRPETQYALGQARRGQKAFVISMPPPNVTGELHLGHAITATMEDLMIRWHRMKGEPTLWVPGSDHASIAVHYVVDKALKSRAPFMDDLLREVGFPVPDDKKKALTRQDLGRETFLKLGWAWRARYGRIITEQHRRLGASCDWERERFTLDPGLSRAVRAAFVRLYKKGLIYRGKRMINWCPRCGTGLSDLETEHADEQGKLWYVRYPLEPIAGAGGETEYITVATTRPETILGDTAVAVSPGDPRYAALVGRRAILPVLGRPIPIIADEAVDRAFGTGAVKVTPAHDPTDYEIGQRHGLAAITAIDPSGIMTTEAGPYAGHDRHACRLRLVAEVESLGLLEKTESLTHAVGHCQRCHTIVEPAISEQWFVSMKPLAEPALDAVRDGRIRLVPERFNKIYFNWLENIRDWNISRQLWWGHRIPVWYCKSCGAITVSEEEAVAACPSCGSAGIEQDPDVLDTWFSSGLWPFSTLGWPGDTEDVRLYYPTSTLETGYDILFFWVARMIMLGLECTGLAPFDTVYLHGMIRNGDGAKMSKTKGNVIDPLKIIDEFGTDALRFAMATGSTPGLDMKLSMTRVEDGRNFANKLWNAARFILAKADLNAAAGQPAPRTLPGRWILSRLNHLCQSVDRLMHACEFGEAGRQIYDFLWGEFCDWYIEATKVEESPPQALLYVLERTLRLLHPFMPFVTEEIWQHLRPYSSTICGYQSIMLSPYPQAEPGLFDDEAERQMGLIMDLVRGIRNARAEFNVEAGKRIEAIVVAGDNLGVAESQAGILASLARLDPARLRVERSLAAKPDQAVAVMAGGMECYLPLAGMVDLEAERARLTKEIEGTKVEAQRAEGRLANPAYVDKAPAAVVEKDRARLAELQDKMARLERRLKGMG